METDGTLQENLIDDAAKGNVDESVARRKLINFIVMATLFSANHGSVTSVIALASSEFSDDGTLSLGILYAFYVIFAMLFAPVTLYKVGKKNALVGSLGLYAVYVAAYLLAVIAPSISTYAICFGAAIGGIGAGLLWTAQGAYYKTNAKQYAEAKGISESDALGNFASYFAALYLGFEVSLKLIGSLVSSSVPGDGGTNTIYAFYTCVTVGSTILMMFLIDPMPSVDDTGDVVDATKKKLYGAITLLFCNAKCSLMVPTNCAFGFAVPLLTSFIQASVIDPTDDGSSDHQLAVHDTRVLLYSALAVGFAAFISIPLGWLRKKAGTTVVMFLGATAFTLVSLSVLLFPLQTLQNASILIPLYLVYGLGRAVWENTVKTVFAEFFDEADAPAAFANIIIQSGLTSSFGFLVYPYYPFSLTSTKAYMCLVSAVAGFLCYVVASRIHTSEKAPFSVNMV